MLRTRARRRVERKRTDMARRVSAPFAPMRIADSGQGALAINTFSDFTGVRLIGRTVRVVLPRRGSPLEGRAR